ncbi:unnamed protein product [Thlaspi arvense]|uniref:Uncharacterized protein n=1 Tax=Thlaspi arvense TaxID=13288 RepID=A0AAU9S6C9_THLAR|nr:unnamed protein product [Thlaspi arvense]
MGLTCSID